MCVPGGMDGGTCSFLSTRKTLMHKHFSSKVSFLAILSLAGSTFVAPAVAHGQQAPVADVIDMSLADNSASDIAADVDPVQSGAPVVQQDPILGKPVISFDGQRDALGFEVGDKFDELKDGFAVECTFRFDGDFDGNEKSLCANKESGGWALAIYDNDLTFTVHVDGSYKQAKMEMQPGQWYHAVGVFDGEKSQLFVNGEQAAENLEATGEMTLPENGATQFIIGGDSGSDNTPQFYSDATFASARLWTEPLSAEDIASLYDAAELTTEESASIVSSTPAEGDHITRPFILDVELNNPDLVARDLEIRLDGEEVELGETIGAGLEEGEHTLEISGHDVFGNPIAESINFTSGNLPGTAGTDTEQGEDGVGISARAENPSGGDLETTFTKANLATAQGGFQGTVNEIPESLDFDYEEGADFQTELAPGNTEAQASASTRDLPFQRFDLQLEDAAAETHDVAWSGTVDPKREVRLYVWNVEEEEWEEKAASAGNANAEVSLTAELGQDYVDGESIHTMVLGYDTFADDLNEPVDEQFAEDYDFAIAHHTDTQYLSEGAVEQETEEERAKWKEGYTAATQWVADNADERKIVYSAHTGDIIENWISETNDLDNAKKEFEVASEAQAILDDAGVVNGVLPGNHDNITGREVGADNLYNQYFGPERYQALQGQGGWAEHDASYHPYAEGDNDNHYDLFSAEGHDFIALHLGYDVTDEEAAWADEVLKQYSDRNAIVLTHAYNKPSNNPDGRGADFSHDGRIIFEEIVEKNPNVALVLSGHEHGVSIVTRNDVGQTGNHVIELLADYQFYEIGSDELGLTEIGEYGDDTGLRFGSSYLRLLQFDLENSEVAINTYSPLLDDHNATEYDDRQRYNGHEDELRLPIQLNTRTTSFETSSMVALTDTGEVIGTDTAKSGWGASTTWTGLTAGESYGWYATSRDADADADSAGIARQFGYFTAQEASEEDSAAPTLNVPTEPLRVKAGDTVDLLEGITATDEEDGDITDRIRVIGNVDTSKPGTYSVSYEVSDSAGNQTIASRVVEVTESGSSDNGSSDDGSSDGSSDNGSSGSSGSSAGSSSSNWLSGLLGGILGAAGMGAILTGLLNFFSPGTLNELTNKVLGFFR
ncbi:Concanavalin A-like lectin/glucanases superfamily [Corynebacterium camporealensis]|uniref:Concanavalin A-like lectin/glucanases superfamily n=2 Tax=Corynebacterium camporealensis TaxID=161896 RepID=A0A0F6TAF7_9CORY|nr:Concanavalin A-like lectin/glucanases superfamily [Corynebacterium camporealensis]AVH87852.1 Concanavalin A-like lectin/glucanases superfamily [Corynebacterium camporealensis]